jgi:hypothetical protein
MHQRVHLARKEAVVDEKVSLDVQARVAAPESTLFQFGLLAKIDGVGSAIQGEIVNPSAVS